MTEEVQGEEEDEEDRITIIVAMRSDSETARRRCLRLRWQQRR